MSVKPLNLSILVGDINRSPDNTPQRTPRVNNDPCVASPKSSNKCRIPPPPGNVGMKPNSKFRQWPDPPAPPKRSRTTERKFNTTKRRTGSVDSRFRRTISIPSKADDGKSFKEIKSDFLLNTSETSAEPKKLEQTIENQVKISPKTSDTNTYIKTSEIKTKSEIMSCKNIDLQSLYEIHDLDNKLEKARGTFEYTEIRHEELESASEIFDNHRTSTSNKIKSQPCSDEKSSLEDEITTEISFSENVLSSLSKSSQTNISILANRIAENCSSVENLLELSDNESLVIFEQYSEKNSETTKADSIILNRTRSVTKSLIEKESQETLTDDEINYYSESTGIIINKECNTNTCTKCSSTCFTERRYFRFIEIWLAIITLLMTILIAWIFVTPYLHHLVSDFYYTWINPKPVETNFIMQFFNDIFTMIGDVLALPAESRIRNM